MYLRTNTDTYFFYKRLLLLLLLENAQVKSYQKLFELYWNRYVCGYCPVIYCHWDTKNVTIECWLDLGTEVGNMGLKKSRVL